MAKRKRTDTVNLKLRIREALRSRLEVSARAHDVSLNAEMGKRLADSFDEARNTFLLEVLLAPGYRLELLRAIATVLRMVGPDWHKPPRSLEVANAINKIVAVFTHELPPIEESFPERKDKTSGDHLAWLAVLAARFQQSVEKQSKGDKP